MKLIHVLLVAVAMLMTACGTTHTVPVTGRSHNLLVDDAQILSLSTEQYSEFMKSAKVSTNQKQTAMVKRVGKNLQTAVEKFLRDNGATADLQYYAWEFNLVNDSQVNAFCMPGGKIVVYEGLLGVANDDASLAIVLGHEIAHAVAKHSAEQMSKQIRQEYGTQIVGGILNRVAGENVTNLAAVLAQQGFSFANLHYSRDNEYEADYMGLLFAAMAGYDPQVAVPFWQRMASSNGNISQSDVLSDHPSDAKRIAALQERMPEALKYYQAAVKK